MFWRSGQAQGTTIPERPLAKESVWPGDDATGDARRRATAGGTRDGVDDDGGAAVAEDGMLIGAEGDIRRDRADVSGSVGPNNQREIRDIAGGMTAMGVLSTLEMGARRFEVGRLTNAMLVDMNGMLAWGKVFDV